MVYSEKRKEIEKLLGLVREAFYLMSLVEKKYKMEEVLYKASGASRKSIKANQEKQELVQECLTVLNHLEEKYLYQVKICSVLEARKEREEASKFALQIRERGGLKYTLPFTIPYY